MIADNVPAGYGESLHRAQQRYDEMQPPEYWDNPMDYDDEESEASK